MCLNEGFFSIQERPMLVNMMNSKLHYNEIKRGIFFAYFLHNAHISFVTIVKNQFTVRMASGIRAHHEKANETIEIKRQARRALVMKTHHMPIQVAFQMDVTLSALSFHLNSFPIFTNNCFECLPFP